jgi:transcriptional regulator with XRE-family HTH domain
VQVDHPEPWRPEPEPRSREPRGLERRSELNDFLRIRRGRLTPADVGLTHYGTRRRTPGLRREELAQLAGLSVDYYTRLEQGRAGRPSPEVLAGLSRALRLDVDEHEHLLLLAERRPAGRSLSRAEQLPGNARRLLDAVGNNPALVLGRRTDVLAWNPAAAALVTDFADRPVSWRNMLRLLFLDAEVRRRYLNWEQIAGDSVAHLRAVSARHPDDARIAALATELSVKSPDFRRWWSRHDVRTKSNGRKEFDHPVVGRLSLDYTTLQLPGTDDVYLVVHTAEAGSPSQSGLDLLAVVGTDRMRAG